MARRRLLTSGLMHAKRPRENLARPFYQRKLLSEDAHHRIAAPVAVAPVMTVAVVAVAVVAVAVVAVVVIAVAPATATALVEHHADAVDAARAALQVDGAAALA